MRSLFRRMMKEPTIRGPAMEALEMLIRFFAALSGIRGHIPHSGDLESFRDDSAPAGRLGNIAMFLTTVFCVAAGLAFVILLGIRWLS